MNNDKRLELAKDWYNDQSTTKKEKVLLENLFPELKEREDIRERLINIINSSAQLDYYLRKEGFKVKEVIAWLEKQKDISDVNGDLGEFIKELSKQFPEVSFAKLARICKRTANWLKKQSEQKEINLVEILRHYPRETELYSPLYGKLWLAEVDEKNEIITCYKHHLEEGCTRAVLKQEDTVSFYSNGTTGLPDFSVSKDCMLFLYDIKKQNEKKPTLSEDDKNRVVELKTFIAKCNGFNKANRQKAFELIDALQPRWKPTEEQMVAFGNAIEFLKDNDYSVHELIALFNDLQSMRIKKL